MVNTELIKKLLTRLKEDAEKGCLLRSSDFSGKNTLNVDAAHDAILYCQPHKHNDDTIFDDEHYTDDSSKQNGNYPGTSRHKSECVSKLEENVCYIRDSFSGVALKGYNNYLDSAGTPKKEEWHKYHFGNTIKTREEIGSGFTKNKDLLKNIKNYSTYLNFDNFIHKEYQLAGDNKDISNFDQHCILGLNFTWQAVLYYGYCQFLKNAPNCGFDTQVNATKIIGCLRQINFTTLEDSVPKWTIGHPDRDMFEAFNVFNSSDDVYDKEWSSMERMNPVASIPYYFITSQSFVHSQISNILPKGYKPDDNKGFEARNEGDEDSAGIGEEEMRKGMEALLNEYTLEIPAKRMLWQFLKFQGDSSHLVFYSIIKVATPASKPISIKVLTGERPLVKRAQLEGKTIMVKKFKVFVKNWSEACSSDGRYIEFVSDPEGQAKTLLAKAVSLKQSEYYADWGDNLDSEINQVDGIIKDRQVISRKDKIKSLKEKMDKFGKYVIKKKIQTYIGGDFKKDAQNFFSLMRPSKNDENLPYLRDAGGKQFDFGKDVDVVFSKLGFLANHHDKDVHNDDASFEKIINMMSETSVGRRNKVTWHEHLLKIVNSFEKHQKADVDHDINYEVFQKYGNNPKSEINLKGLTTFVCMNYYVMRDKSTFSSSSDSYQKVYFFSTILKFFLDMCISELDSFKTALTELGVVVGGSQVGGNREEKEKILKDLQNEYDKVKGGKRNLYGAIFNAYSKVVIQLETLKNPTTARTARTERLPEEKEVKADGTYWELKELNDAEIKAETDIEEQNKIAKSLYDKKGYITYSKSMKKETSENSVHENNLLYSIQVWENHQRENDLYIKKLFEAFGEEPYERLKFKNVGRYVYKKKDLTYKQLLYEKAIFKKFLDTFPSDITVDNLNARMTPDNLSKTTITLDDIENKLPEYKPEFPYTIWWIYTYINKDAPYEDFTKFFNVKQTKTSPTSHCEPKYYFEDEEKFMIWKEKILSYEYNASIRYKYEFFLVETFYPDIKEWEDSLDNLPELKIFTELEIKHIIVSTISLSGRFSDDNAILEDMEYVNLIKKSLNKKIDGYSLGPDKQKVIDKMYGKKHGVEIIKTLTFEEALDVNYETALREGRVYDVTGDVPEVVKPGAEGAAASLASSSPEVFKPIESYTELVDDEMDESKNLIIKSIEEAGFIKSDIISEFFTGRIRNS